MKYKCTANKQYNIILIKNRCLLFIMRTSHLNCVVKCINFNSYALRGNLRTHYVYV